MLRSTPASQGPAKPGTMENPLENPTGTQSRPARDGSQRSDSVTILYENDAWNAPLVAALETYGISVDLRTTECDQFALHSESQCELFFNRVSPSSKLRGNPHAISYTLELLKWFEAQGHRVLNGSRAFQLEVSKVEQCLLFKRLRLPYPKTLAFSSVSSLVSRAAELTYPLILKPNTGGSGMDIKRADSPDELRFKLGDLHPSSDGVWLVQPLFEHTAVNRLEFIGSKLVAAYRVVAENTFNLCPATGCPRHPVDPDGAIRVEFQPWTHVDSTVLHQAQKVVREAKLDVGGVELLETPLGPLFLDINATSVYRPETELTFGQDPWKVLSRFVETELNEIRLRKG